MRYRHTGVVLVRATTYPGDLDPPPDLDLSDPTAIERGRTWLAAVWARSEVRDALRLASPALTARLDQILQGPSSPKQVRRAVTSMASYLLRWQRRATPFGLFAGVGTASIGPAVAKVGVEHRVELRADAEWVLNQVEQLEQHPALRDRLTVVADNTRFVRSGRVITHKRAPIGASSPGALRESSVRLTQPVGFALAAAGTPIGLETLVDEVSARFPTASLEKVRTLLHGLIDTGLLITSLRAPMTAVDSLTHLVQVLRTAGADSGLGEIHELLRSHNEQNCAGLRAQLADRMVARTPGPVLAVDVALDARVVIPATVLTEAASAASVLVRTTTQPFGSASWLDYHARFRARYGPGALVPVLELVSDAGLGYPSGYLGAPRARPAWRTLTERDAALLALIQQATLTGADEVVLSEADVNTLTVGDHTTAVPPERVELGVAIHAPSTEAINRGDFQLRVTAAPRAHTSMAGRFAHLLDKEDRARLAATYTTDDALAVHLSFPPRRPHNENVTRVAPQLPTVLHLTEHPAAAVATVSINELAVTADDDQLYLVHQTTGRRVAPQITHALDTTAQTPPLARFLAEVANARTAVFRSFDLGAARTLPYVPRIRYRRTVLASARWLLTPRDLTDTTLQAWQHRWRVPNRVVLVDGELRLPLNLDHALDRSLLQGRLDRADRVELHEDGPPNSDGWIGRPAELLIPLTATNPVPRPLPSTTAPAAVLTPGGSTLVQVRITGNPARFDEILTTHLPAFATSLGELVDHWWVRRHRDMIRLDADHHLAVLLRLADPGQFSVVTTRVAEFASELERNGLPGQLTLTSTPQHPARYGDGPAATAAERVFAADTAAALAQIASARDSDIPAQALAAVSMADMAAYFAADRQVGYRSLLRCLPQASGRVCCTSR
ncbi:lantibiotic dehydratase [Actinokineospora inagensis]|uniref:lantibiotic dehydratase n=1 Tax=Actinokineospora inagensis TaxID=103730 RepID=UPI000424AE9D|nr:lantibiotic dehydratase [Actinokineospora inagensis]